MRNLTVFVCFLALSFSTGLYGQDGKLALSVYGGLTVSSIEPKPQEALEEKFRTGFLAGAQLHWRLNDHWSFPLAVQYAQRGFYYNTEGTFIRQDNGQLALYRGRIDYRIGYIDIMPQVAFAPVQFLSIAVGPYLSSRIQEEGRYGDFTGWINTRDEGLYENTDFGLAGKLNIHYNRFTLFAGFQFGLKDVSNLILADANGQEILEMGAKNRSFSAGLAFRIF